MERGKLYRMYLYQEVQIYNSHAYRKAISLLPPQHVGGLRQAITKLAKTVTILQEPLNFGDFKHTSIHNTHHSHTHTHTHTHT